MTTSPVASPNCYIFSSRDDAEQSFPGKKIVSKVVLDPRFDDSFCSVLSFDEEKKELLIHFLNSIYFPDAKDGDIMIRKIEGKKQSDVPKSCDIACRCYCYASGSDVTEQTVFDVLLEREFSDASLKSLIKSTSAQDAKSDVSIQALGLMNMEPLINYSLAEESSYYSWCKTDPKTRVPECQDCEHAMEANAIDFRMFGKKDKELFVNGKKLGISGITWLKLLGVAQWCKGKEDKKFMYEIYFPENGIDPIIKRAIEILDNPDRRTFYWTEVDYIRSLSEASWRAAYVKGFCNCAVEIKEKLMPHFVRYASNEELEELKEYLVRPVKVPRKPCVWEW